MTHICVGNQTIIGSDNGLSPGRRQAIIWTNAGILLIRTLGTNFSEILGEIHSFSFSKMHLKMSSAKWRLFGLGLNELTHLLTYPLTQLLTNRLSELSFSEIYITIRTFRSQNFGNFVQALMCELLSFSGSYPLNWQDSSCMTFIFILQVLFRTVYINNTNHDQEFSFKTERVTRSYCDVRFEEAFTIGHKMNVKLATPCEVREANAGFLPELYLTDSRGQTFEKELIWSVDSFIKVPPNIKTTAQLVVYERKLSRKFTVKTVFSGKVHATITNMRSNNSFVKAIEGDVVDIMRNAWKMKNSNVESEKVSVITKGECNFTYAFEQHVTISQK